MRLHPPAASKPAKLSWKEQRELEGTARPHRGAGRRAGPIQARLNDPAIYQDAPQGNPSLNARLQALEGEIEAGDAALGRARGPFGRQMAGPGLGQGAVRPPPPAASRVSIDSWGYLRRASRSRGLMWISFDGRQVIGNRRVVPALGGVAGEAVGQLHGAHPGVVDVALVHHRHQQVWQVPVGTSASCSSLAEN